MRGRPRASAYALCEKVNPMKADIPAAGRILNSPREVDSLDIIII